MSDFFLSYFLYLKIVSVCIQLLMIYIDSQNVILTIYIFKIKIDLYVF